MSHTSRKSWTAHLGLAPTASGVRVFGGGRKPGPRPTLSLSELAAWNAANARAVEANRRTPQREAMREAIGRGMEKREQR